MWASPRWTCGSISTRTTSPASKILRNPTRVISPPGMGLARREVHVCVKLLLIAEIDCEPGEAQEKLDAFRAATVEALTDQGISLHRLTTATDLSKIR